MEFVGLLVRKSNMTSDILTYSECWKSRFIVKNMKIVYIVTLLTVLASAEQFVSTHGGEFRPIQQSEKKFLQTTPPRHGEPRYSEQQETRFLTRAEKVYSPDSYSHRVKDHGNILNLIYIISAIGLTGYITYAIA